MFYYLTLVIFFVTSLLDFEIVTSTLTGKGEE